MPEECPFLRGAFPVMICKKSSLAGVHLPPARIFLRAFVRVIFRRPFLLP